MAEKTQLMWDTILKLVVVDAKEIDTYEFGRMFDVIRTNLIFDDPGLISTEYYRSHASEIEREECLNFWLLNQLVFNSVQIVDQRSIDHVNYQKDIITGTFAKKPSLFHKIMKEYIQLIDKLSKNQANNNPFPIQFELFHSKNTKYLDEILPDIKFTLIELNNVRQQELLLENSVKVVSHILLDAVHVHSELMEECTLSILHALNTSSIAIKTLCFDYLLKALQTDYQLYSKYLPNIFKAYHKILLNLQLWIEIDNVNGKQLESLKKNFVLFLEAIKSYYEDNFVNENIEGEVMGENDAVNKIVLENLFNIINFIATVQKRTFNWQDLIEDTTRIILWESKNVILDNQYLNTIKNCNLLKISPNLIEVYEFTVLTQIQDNLSNRIVENISEAWKAIYNDIFDKYIKSIVDFKDANIRVVAGILRLVNNIEFKLKVLHQRELASKIDYCRFCNDTVCGFNEYEMESLFFNNEKLVAAIDKILNSMKHGEKLDETVFINFTTFFNLIIQNLIFFKFPQDLQNRVVGIYFQYFQKVVNINNNFPFKNLPTEKIIVKKCIEFISNRNMMKYNHNGNDVEQILQRIYARQDLQIFHKEFLPKIINLLKGNLIGIDFVENFILKPFLASANNAEMDIDIILPCIQKLICLLYGNIKIYRMKTCESNKAIVISCDDCDVFNLNNHSNYKIIKNGLKQNFEKPVAKSVLMKSELLKLFPTINLSNSKIFLTIFSHTNCIQNDLIVKNWKILSPQIIQLLLAKYPPSIYEPILEEFIKDLQSNAYEICRNGDINEQKDFLKLINDFAVTNLPEKFFLLLFKFTILFIIPVESKIQNESAALAESMCSKYKISSKKLLNWYQKDILKLIVKLYVSVYLIHGCGLQSSLKIVSNMLGFADQREFVLTYFKTIVAMLLPFVIEIRECEELLNEIGSLIKLNTVSLLKKSFVNFYLLYLIDEQLENSDECLKYLEEKTDQKIFILINSDMNKIVARMLFYYHKNPKIVMETFRCALIHKSTSGMSGSSSSSVVALTQSKDVAKFIADRFLGVVTYFEYHLMNLDFEKVLKYEILLSLGEIIRFLGSIYITPFHFKILALLSTVITINNESLKAICIDVWSIFIHTVDVQVLGPSLSRIVATLQPELSNHGDKINAIYHFLIISNVNLLSIHIPDLYFIEKFEYCSKEIKDAVNKIINRNEIENVRKLETKIKSSDKLDEKLQEVKFLEKIKFFLKQISHENITVRVNGIIYLKELFSINRSLLNKIILGQNFVNPLIELVLGNLIIGCKDSDVNLKLASGKCLGELGAIEPGLLKPNYSEQEKLFPLTIHSNKFAVMALKELCKAYQFQKDTQYVDNFSLGIQEILRTNGVCPQRKAKMDIWNAIPDRMKQIMEPFLSSSYTGLQKSSGNIQNTHPIFGSSKGKTFIDWAFNWSTNMVNTIDNAETKHLLNSLLPSLRRDNKILDVILPYIVVHSLKQENSNESRNKINEELNAVFESIGSRTNKIPEIKNNVIELSFQNPSSDSRLPKYEVANDINLNKKCAKLGLELLDFIERWIREYKAEYPHENDKSFTAVQKFYDSFNKLEVAETNFLCGEYARALKYFENYLFSNQLTGPNLQKHLSFLIKIYVELMDLDALEGAMYIKQSNSSLKEQILVNTMTERLHDTMACYEQLMMEKSNELNELTPSDWDGIVQCYLRLDTPETALLISQGIMNRLGSTLLNESLKEIQAEPLWRLGRFDELEELMNNPIVSNSNNWSVKCGQALVVFHKNSEDFDQKIDDIRYQILKIFKFSGTDFDIYHKEYSQIVKLHLVTDIEKARNFVKSILENPFRMDTAIELLRDFFKDWNDRLAFLQPIVKVTEPYICLRRLLLLETKQLIKSQVQPHLLQKIDEEIGELWIKSIKLNRKAGCYHQAHLNILNAERFKPKNLFIEKAKCLWSKGDQTQCFKVLEENLSEFDKLATIEELPQDKRLLYAEGKFLQAFYNAESMNIDSDLNITYFMQSLKANKNSEKSYVYMAQYYDKICSTLSGTENSSVEKEKLNLYSMFNYGRSMKHGCEYMYQSMPRLLSIWFDCNESNTTDTITNKMNEVMNDLLVSLPLFLFFTAFSQLVSRICHPSEPVWKVLKSIVVRLIIKYPQHSLWMILPIFKSSLPSRVKRCAEIFNDKNLKSMQNLIKDFNSLADKLIELTNMDIPTSPTPPISKIIRQLPKLLENPEFSSIMIPFEKFMQITLPPLVDRRKSVTNHSPFPNNLVYIKGIRDEICILKSMQKPKKIAVVGSDGKEYTFMLKPRDDLRKDFRLMEFNAVVKQYLYQDPQARQRRLGIRTYAVQPLNEECGIIEWVDNLNAFRHILLNIYKSRQLGMGLKELSIVAKDKREPERLRSTYLQKLLPKHPPVFHEWFLKQFPNSYNWYQARTTYIRSTAVMSIVGYILGLGDRHGENILLDSETGDIFHVDFNCLFNRGESFAVPEVVPFRLTHNMVRAMGPLGVEGPFRKCCEITMRVLQMQTPILMSVLRPFIYDPMVSWNKKKRDSKNLERTDEEAITNVKRTEARLKGFVNRVNSEEKVNIPLSPEGVVNYIIQQAIDIDNLAAMYIGWGSFL